MFTIGIKIDFEPETKILLSRMIVPPSNDLKDLINKTIRDLKNDGVFQLGDCLYIRGVHDSQAACLNWIKNAHDSTLVNSPTFTPKVGFKGDGSSKYINNVYKLKSEGVNWNMNSATIFLLMNNMGTINDRYFCGAVNTVDVRYTMILYFSAANERTYLNGVGSYQTINMSNGDYVSFSRNATKIRGYQNGIYINEVTCGQDTDVVDYNMFELSRDANGGPNTYTDATISASFYGGYLTDTQNIALYTRIKYYFDNVKYTF